MALSVNTTITRMMDEPDFPVIVHAKQNDKRTRFVTLRCSDTENGFSIPSGTVGIVRVRKNDGTACFYDKNDLGDAAVVIDGNSVTIELVEQALTAAGMQKAEVNLYTPDGAKITTFSFALEVEASVLTDAQIVSSDYYNVLTSDISSALAAAVAADASAEEAAAQAAEAAASEVAAAQSKAAAVASAAAADASKSAAANSAAAAATSEANAASSKSAAASSASAAATSQTNAADSQAAAAASASAAAASETAASASASAAAQSAQAAQQAADSIDSDNLLEKNGDGAAVTVPFTAPVALPALPSSPATLEALMTMLASMRNRLAALEESMPGIGEWWYSPNVITYTGGVNSKAYARVNFNDDLSKTVYAVLYAKIGDSLSSGAADGFFNCKKLAERFPLAYGANFLLRSWGGSAIHNHGGNTGGTGLTSSQNGPHVHYYATNPNSQGSSYFGPGIAGSSEHGPNASTDSSGEGDPHHHAISAADHMPPYLVQNIIVRAL